MTAVADFGSLVWFMVVISCNDDSYGAAAGDDGFVSDWFPAQLPCCGGAAAFAIVELQTVEH